jgi:integrase
LGYFFFSYLHGGVNIADIMGLGFTDFYFDEGGFSYKRRKTIRKNQFKVYVPATTHTATLFSVLGITPSRGSLVFPELGVSGGENEFYKQKENATNRANRDLKKAAAECGIDKNITMTTARHTFATLANKSGMPYDMVERAMGHANNGVSSHYIGAWSLAEMRPCFEKLL